VGTLIADLIQFLNNTVSVVLYLENSHPVWWR